MAVKVGTLRVEACRRVELLDQIILAHRWRSRVNRVGEYAVSSNNNYNNKINITVGVSILRVEPCDKVEHMNLAIPASQMAQQGEQDGSPR